MIAQPTSTVGALPMTTQPTSTVAALPPPQDAGGTVDVLANLDSIAWIDWTALVLLGVFFVLGLFKGLVWQVSRVLSLIAAWFLAGQYGEPASRWIEGWFGPEEQASGLPLYLAYVVVFVLALVVLSLLTWLLQKLVKQSGLSTVDRLGGAVVGLATGSIAVLAILALTFMFVPEDWGVVRAARRSYTMEISKQALSVLGDVVPGPMQRVFEAGTEPGAGPRDR
jgi:membrane protein required for colicin V production